MSAYIITHHNNLTTHLFTYTPHFNLRLWRVGYYLCGSTFHIQPQTSKYTCHTTPHPQQQAKPPHPLGLHRYTAFTMQSMSCAHCGVYEGEGVSLKACKSCMLVKYCNPKCQRNHWPKHKKLYKQRAAESYMMRLSSRNHRRKRTVPFASYQCRRNW